MAYSANSSDPVDLVVRNFALVAALFTWVVASWKKAKKKSQEKSPPAAAAAADEAARTRRVQQEVRRKIAERRGVSAPLAVAPLRTVPPVVLTEEVSMDLLAGGMERQRKLAEEIRALDAARPAAPAAPAYTPPVMAAAPVSNWLIELRAPESARRAIVWREILGPPVGLR